jgi:two-component system nitrate/nitrite response regulator NarL
MQLETIRMKLSSLALYSYQLMVAECLEIKIAESRYLSVVATTIESEAIIEIATQHKPDLFLVDCCSPDRGIGLVRDLRKVLPETKVVLFTGIESSEHAVIALDMGAAGYISSACTKIDVVEALELIAAGQTFVSPHIAALVIKRFRASTEERKKTADQRLSLREEQIAKLLVQGQTNRAIADSLGLSEKTIKYYMTNLMQKFEARNRVELAMALPKKREAAHYFQ